MARYLDGLAWFNDTAFSTHAWNFNSMLMCDFDLEVQKARQEWIVLSPLLLSNLVSRTTWNLAKSKKISRQSVRPASTLVFETTHLPFICPVFSSDQTVLIMQSCYVCRSIGIAVAQCSASASASASSSITNNHIQDISRRCKARLRIQKHPTFPLLLTSRLCLPHLSVKHSPAQQYSGCANLLQRTWGFSQPKYIDNSLMPD
jgi:hypothetical protein